MKARTREELLLLRQKKFDSPYKVKGGLDTVTKDVDFSTRTVKSIPNTFLYFDSDQDVLLPGSTIKSINERGPNSSSPAKIKNVYAHDLKQNIGKPLLMDERTIDGKQLQYAESKMFNTTKGNDTLIEYQEGGIDQHSIGFQYVDLKMVTADDKDWTKWLSQIINPNDAEEYGYMFLSSEIKQFEWSPVAFGANDLTPFLGVKSGNKDGMALKVIERVNWLEKQLTSGRQSDETMYDYTLEALQLKQIITELFLHAPSIKDTLIAERRHNEDNHDNDTVNKSMRICNGCLKQFEAEDGKIANCPGCGKFVAASTMPVDFDLSKLKFFQDIKI